MFYIEIKGKKTFYKTLEKASLTASDIFEKTGIAVGIQTK